MAELSSSDWVVNQLATYEYGGLRRFLRTVADPDFVARADRIVEWADAPVSGYRFEDVLDDRVLVTELATRRSLDVLNLGSTWAHEGGSTVIGRLVPISIAPGWMFESRPLAVDPITATEVASSATAWSDEWTAALTRARQDDRLPLGFSTLVLTSYVTDLPGGGARGLEAEGVDTAGPEEAVALADFVLDQVGIDPTLASHMAMQLVCLLLDPDLRAGVSERCTQSSRRAAWAAISRGLPEPISGYAEAMADLASMPR